MAQLIILLLMITRIYIVSGQSGCSVDYNTDGSPTLSFQLDWRPPDGPPGKPGKRGSIGPPGNPGVAGTPGSQGALGMRNVHLQCARIELLHLAGRPWRHP